MDQPLSDIEARVLYMLIEQGSATVSQLTNKLSSTTRVIEEAIGQLVEQGLLEEQAEGVFGATDAGMGRWNEVIYLAAEYP